MTELCESCGGHGCVIVGEVTLDTPDLTAEERARLLRRQARGNPRPLLRMRDCPGCDGRDRVTPIIEAEIETRLADG